MSFFGLRTIKSSLGFVLAIYVAQVLGLDFPISAGLITILSILETRRQSLRVALKRVVSCFVGLTLAVIVFTAFGFHLPTLGIYLLAFFPLIDRLDLKEGTMTNIVLVTHLMALESVSGQAIGNELMLMFIGILIGLLLNLHMPSREEDIKKQGQKIEKLLAEVLTAYAYELKNACVFESQDNQLANLKLAISEGKRLALLDLNNSLFQNDTYHLDYMVMRKRQYERLKEMARHIKGTLLTQDVAEDVSQLTLRVASNISEDNDGRQLLKVVGDMFTTYRKGDLPQDRQSFEDRAHLFLYMSDLEFLIRLKADFVNDHKG